MRAEAYLTARAVVPAEIDDGVAVVVDVIRATSTVVTALAHGARAIYPTVSTEEAIKLASSLGRDDTLLCGERKGLKVEGFDLGNSPSEFVSDTVEGKRLVMSTTNGTRAFLAASGAERIVSAAFLNLAAVVESVADEDRVSVICAGKDDRFSLDDAVCGGHLLRELAERRGEELETNDAAAALLRLADDFAPSEAFLRGTAAGRALVEIGLEADLSLCAERDRFHLVPTMEDRMIRIPGADARE